MRVLRQARTQERGLHERSNEKVICGTKEQSKSGLRRKKMSGTSTPKRLEHRSYILKGEDDK